VTATLRVFAPAKINLALHVIGRRPDGYHLLDSLVAFADIGDDVTVGMADTFSVSVTGPFAAGLIDAGENIALRAARFLSETSPPSPVGTSQPRGARISLVKNLPVAAGLGGGSADAAATLLACQRLWGIATLPAMPEIARALGADVPVCLRSRTSVMRGIGDELMDAGPLPSCALVLANPGATLPTAAVFKAFAGEFSAPLAPIGPHHTCAALAEALTSCRNDLTRAATDLAPEIGTVIAELQRQAGCRLARMSGSGATCFGLFAHGDEAARAARNLIDAHPSWWVRAGQLAEFPAHLRVQPAP
jgi:4-diphosphocytidyl-2-C-methyl-D-erythritol kinase